MIWCSMLFLWFSEVLFVCLVKRGSHFFWSLKQIHWLDEVFFKFSLIFSLLKDEDLCF